MAAHADRPRRTGSVPPGLFYTVFSILLLSNALTLAGFLMSPDIAALIARQKDVLISSYENRISDLRLEVDRLHSRQYARAGDFNLQMQELVQEHELLAEQHQYVRALASKAAALGIVVADGPEAPAADGALTGALADQPGTPADIETVRQSIHDMMSDSQLALSALSGATNEAADSIVAELRKIGIRPDLSRTAQAAMGGPLLGPASGAGNDLLDEANAIMTALNRLKTAQAALGDAPVHRPLSVAIKPSSGFGNRTDPFLRKAAFHSGIDFPAQTGTKVLAAGPGEVTFAGRQSGYGNLVEVRHKNGFTTRYAHMSVVLVTEGDVVSAGSVIGKVGSTGRSTGPHLHFEVRTADGPVNPLPFLNAGNRLARFL